MFSNPELAKWINDHFEPTWLSLRPVPRVTIDFGNGKVVQRTLHGNIATWVCTNEGMVLDVLPGLYEANAYKSELSKLSDLHGIVSTLKNDKQLAGAMARYHEGCLEQMPDDARVVAAASEDLSTVDTMYNQLVRRRAIHQRFAELGAFDPMDQAKWLYREVLHADLDDPYMGLANALFANYPFAD